VKLEGGTRKFTVSEYGSLCRAKSAALCFYNGVRSLEVDFDTYKGQAGLDLTKCVVPKAGSGVFTLYI